MACPLFETANEREGTQIYSQFAFISVPSRFEKWEGHLILNPEQPVNRRPFTEIPMFLLLLRTRFRYYRNFVRAHFDRVTLVELGLIGVIFLYLTVRSPADIGYRLEALFSPEFVSRWPAQWLTLLPLFYFVTECMAWVSLRPAGEWQLLGTLPFARHAVTRYHLVRHFLKTAGLLAVGILPFAFIHEDFFARSVQVATVAAVMLALQLLAFCQAYILRRPISWWKKWARWGSAEALIASALVFSSESQSAAIQAIPLFELHHLFMALVGVGIVAIYTHRICAPELLFESRAPARQPAFEGSAATSKIRAACSGFLAAQIKRDLLMLKRCRPAVLFIYLTALLLPLAVTAAQETASHAYASALFLHMVGCWIMINALMYLFQQEATDASLARLLPVSARQWWQARWWFAFGTLASPVFLTAAMIAVRFGMSFKWALWAAAAGLVLPAIFALLFCNAILGMFPHVNYAGILMNVFVLLTILFWFYMPFGSLLLLGFMLARVRKAQRHFQLLEI